MSYRPTSATAALVIEAYGCGTPVPVSALRALGIGRGRLRAALESGTLVQLRRGVVSAPPTVEPPGPGAATSGIEAARAQHLVAARAALMALADDSVLSHLSSALIQGLPTYHAPPSLVWVTAPRHGRVVAGTHRRIGDVESIDTVLVEGVPCTTVARTALDLARRQPLHVSLVALDAALTRVDPYDLRSAMARLTWVYDLNALSQAIDRADPRSESPLESISRGYMIEGGIPRPELQQWITADDGRRYRVDFLWRDRRVIGEADGWVKYASIEDVREEKRREDALRRMGYVIVRWTYDELRKHPDRVIARIRAALART
jgi:very-short-patch-repair endonuclease